MNRALISRSLCLLLMGAVIASNSAWGAGSDPLGDRSPEDFHIELLGSAWIVDSAGTLHSSGTFIDLRNDLGFEQQKTHFSGRLVFKPGRKHRIFVEGTPLQDNGLKAINRTITFNGETFNVSETVKSNIDLNVLYAGYQYDLISNPYGHLGVSVSGVYLDGTGTLSTVPDKTNSSDNEKIGLGIAGVEFRIFPIPTHSWFDLDGSARGMDYGTYGHFIEGNLNAGLWFANHVTVQAGYRWMQTQLQDSNDATTGSGLKVNVKGPVFSAGFRW